MNKYYCILPVVLVLAACGQATDSGTPFASQDDQWEAALNGGDVEGLVAIYAEDARILPPNAEAASGHDAVRTIFGGMIEGGISAELATIETQSSGDVAYAVGTYKMFAGGEVIDQGKYVETWRRGADDTWRMTNDIFNSDLPVPACECGEAGGADSDVEED